ncbi:MAG: sulfotransferase [Oleiagrimonas sp.]|jgi:tetratricopeptide (TPR) repeat protein|nr:tetratricopeptide repeat-containing sulfotransferase family protein [Oleiagrimonas sp.]MDA3913042.1 sulfotransferase [Oleiagrimonas sp.]
MTSGPVDVSEDRLRLTARQAVESGRLEAAQSSLESLLQHNPADAHARLALAQVVLQRGQLRAATGHLLHIVQALPNDAPLIIQLVPLLHLTGEIVAARSCLDHLARAPNPPPRVLAAQANLRWILGEIETAARWMDRAVQAGVDSPDERYLQALLHQFTGDMERAASELESCLQRWPGFGAAAVVLANLPTRESAQSRLAFLEAQLARIPEATGSVHEKRVRAEYASAFFTLLDGLGRQDEAWQALQQSNAVMHELLPYDAGEEVAIIDTILEAAASLCALGADAQPRHAGPMPIFIVGMPRSGSTLLERMLSNHSQVASTGEINDFMCQLHWTTDVAPGGMRSMQEIFRRSPGIDFAQLGARYLEQTQWRAQGNTHFIDKMLINIQAVPLIRRALPEAPILHLVRDPMDVCFSNLKANFGLSSPYSYDMLAMAHYHDQHARLVAQWHASQPGAMLDVHYSDLVHSPEATLRSVLAHCGLEPEVACLRPEHNTAPVATRSSPQVREAIHTRSIAQWQRYARQLEPLRKALA